MAFNDEERRRRDAMTLPELYEELEKSQTTRPDIGASERAYVIKRIKEMEEEQRFEDTEIETFYKDETLKVAISAQRIAIAAIIISSVGLVVAFFK